jgi:hypothetical protein
VTDDDGFERTDAVHAHDFRAGQDDDLTLEAAARRREQSQKAAAETSLRRRCHDQHLDGVWFGGDRCRRDRRMKSDDHQVHRPRHRVDTRRETPVTTSGPLSVRRNASS